MKKRYSTSILAGVLVVGAAVPAAAQITAPRRAQVPSTSVELIVDRQLDASTRELWMGLRFELDQGWHVYWKNPGDSGAPPMVLWQLAAGASISEFEWPLPERIPLGPLMNFGYTVETTIPFRVRLNKPPGSSPLVIAGDFEWQICRELCVPGRTRLSITLPLATEERASLPTWKRLIDDARKRVPAAAPASWRAHTTVSKEDLIVTIRMDKPVAPAVFFPLELDQVDNAAEQDAKVVGQDLVLRLRRAAALKAPPRALRGVLALSSGQAFVIEAPVR